MLVGTWVRGRTMCEVGKRAKERWKKHGMLSSPVGGKVGRGKGWGGRWRKDRVPRNNEKINVLTPRKGS